jgi:hypothetical protein
MIRVLPIALLALATVAPQPARADDAADFMERFSGDWLGAGKLLIGPDNGLKFGCALNGDPSRTGLTFWMRGRCWMGNLSANVYAQIRYNAETNQFYGRFLDGAEGNGLNIVGARDGDGFSLRLVRGSAQGRLAAETVTPDQMKVTIFYRDRARNRELPVVAMGLARKDAEAPLPEFAPPAGGSASRSE